MTDDPSPIHSAFKVEPTTEIVLYDIGKCAINIEKLHIFRFS